LLRLGCHQWLATRGELVPGALAGAGGVVDEHNMLHKANVIAAFFAGYPHDEAAAGIANHIRMYWVPRMRAQLIDYVEAHGSEGLHELVPDAVSLLEKPVIRT
jgi:formate dehydrogenase subunit delta